MKVAGRNCRMRKSSPSQKKEDVPGEAVCEGFVFETVAIFQIQYRRRTKKISAKINSSSSSRGDDDD